ncbi:unnamed protein product, partial [Mesocestoides corti]
QPKLSTEPQTKTSEPVPHIKPVVDPPDTPKDPPKAEPEVQNGVLPEGFFDDARRDAQARNVPFKDKMDAEMETFLKELGSLNEESEKILEKDNEEMVTSRNLAELDKQISMWEKVRKLEQQKDVSMAHKKTSGVPKSEQKVSIKKEEEDDDEDSDIDEDELNGFRFKAGVR